MNTTSKMKINDYELVQTCYACPEQYDVFDNNVQVGYLRLRNGKFTATAYANGDVEGGGVLVYNAKPKGESCFCSEEREFFLTEAVEAIMRKNAMSKGSPLKNTIHCLIGCAGSGKTKLTTILLHQIGDMIKDTSVVSVVSPHEIRETLNDTQNGDAYSQEREHDVFVVAEYMVLNLLYKARKHYIEGNMYDSNVIIDATSHNRHSRLRWVDIAKKTNSTIHWHFIRCSLNVAIARNRTRFGMVPEDVIKRQLDELVIPCNEEMRGVDWHMTTYDENLVTTSMTVN